MLMSSWKNVTIEVMVSPIQPSTPPKNQLSCPSSCTQSRASLNLSWSSVVSWKPRALVHSPFQSW